MPFVPQLVDLVLRAMPARIVGARPAPQASLGFESEKLIDGTSRRSMAGRRTRVTSKTLILNGKSLAWLEHFASKPLLTFAAHESGLTPQVELTGICRERRLEGEGQRL